MKKIIFSAFIILMVVFSFARTETFYNLGFDQERDYLAVKDIVISHKFTLIGPQAVSSTAFFLGPYYYYLLVPFFIIFRGYPAFGAYVADIVSFVTGIYLFYVLSKHSKNNILPMVGSLLWSSVLRHTSWNVMLVPLISFILLDLTSSEKLTDRNILLASFLVGLGVNFHFQFVFFLPLIFLITFRRKIKLIFMSIISFIIPFTPIILFDIRHSFINLSSGTSFFSQNVGDKFGWIVQGNFSFAQFFRESGFIFSSNQNIAVLLFLTAMCFIIISLRKSRRLLIILIVPATSLFILSLYSHGRWPGYYHDVAVATIFFLLFISLAKNKITQQGLLFKIIIIIFLVNISFGMYYLVNSDNPQGFKYQKQLILYILFESKPFNRPNVTYDFPLGEGLGFGVIRDYFEVKSGEHNPSVFFVSYQFNPKHNSTKKTFGAYSVSRGWINSI